MPAASHLLRESLGYEAISKIPKCQELSNDVYKVNVGKLPVLNSQRSA
jgi:hypothetical protein